MSAVGHRLVAKYSALVSEIALNQLVETRTLVTYELSNQFLGMFSGWAQNEC